MPPVIVHWYDGGLTPPRLKGMEDTRDLSGEDNEGLLFVGDRGAILCGFSGEEPRLIPESRMKSFQPPPKTLPRSPGHDREWIEACKGGPPPGANFEFEAAVTETILLGNVAVRAGKKLRWDSAKLQVTNVPSAQPLVSFPYRPGWAL